MDADDLDEALSDLGVSSIHSSPPAEEMADGSSNANIGVVPLVASSANLNQVATNTNVPNGSAAVTIVAQGTTNPPARHSRRGRGCLCDGSLGAAVAAARRGSCPCGLALSDPARLSQIQCQSSTAPAAARFTA